MENLHNLALDKITSEFKKGFDFLCHTKKAVVMFGSATTKPDDKYYKLAYEVGKRLSCAGFNIITGAGPGEMEAANKGAMEGKGKSIGLNIKLPSLQDSNDYLTHKVTFSYFYARKVMFARYSMATLVFPGGYGTLDELFDQLTILQNNKITQRPLVLIGKEFYSPLLKWIEGTLLKENKIKEKDLGLIKQTDNIDEIVKIVEDEWISKNCK